MAVVPGHTNVYVSGFPDGIDDMAFKAMFESFGTVVSTKTFPSKLGPDADLGCFGFVKFQTAEQAQLAISTMNGFEQSNGRKLHVQLAAKQDSGTVARPTSAPKTVELPGQSTQLGLLSIANQQSQLSALVNRWNVAEDQPCLDDETDVAVSGLPEETTEIVLKGLFDQFGNIVSTKVTPGAPGTGKNGVVRFSEMQEAQNAVALMNGHNYNGFVIQAAIKARAVAVDAFGAAALAGTAAATEYSPNLFGQAAIADTSALASSNGVPSDQLYIKGLPAAITDEEVAVVFGAYGTLLSAQAMKSASFDEASALVRMSSVEEAQWMVDNLNGNIPQGLSNPVSVKFAGSGKSPTVGALVAAGGLVPSAGPVRTQAELHRASPYGATVDLAALAAAPAAGPSKVKAAAKPELMKAVSSAVSKLKGFTGDPQANLYVQGLPPGADDLYMYQVFAPFGALTDVNVMTNPDGNCRGIGFVKFGIVADAQLAIAALNGNPLPDGNIIYVSVKREKH